MPRLRIRYIGTVQGVGFRPHIFRLAKAHGLAGFVNNDPAGVTVEVEGPQERIQAFLDESVQKAPVLARISELACESIPPVREKAFKIKESERADSVDTQVSPDAATCPECLNEIFDPQDRRYRYAFTNCTNCGPRYTIIQAIPYDRPYTTMKDFTMCPNCHREYNDPLDRRFHAQPNACPECGPRLVLLDRAGKKIPGDPISKSIEMLRLGKIIAVKSLGGFQLACDALNQDAVKTLRARKYREDKPFAIMAQNLDQVKKYAIVEDAERELILSPERPIVLLPRRKEPQLAEAVAPGQKNWGFMLPYTPLHHILVRESGMILVMTSGNLSDEPIAYLDHEARSRLNRIADYYLTHNRPIYIRCDDSVVRALEGKPFFVRRARGYTPRILSAKLPGKKSILACGAHLKNTFCLARSGQVIVSHHIGDLDNLETLRAFEEGIEHLKRIFQIQPEAVAHDLHPEYLSTRYALGLDLPRIPVQHHHAHTAAVMAEHGIQGPVIGVSMDGTGYGPDEAVWGGEFLIADYLDFDRKAHLCYIPLPGGEQAIKEPWRMMAIYLERIYGEEFLTLDIPSIRAIDPGKWQVLKKAVEAGFNSPQTSSMGRLFDAVSAVLGIRTVVNYEGQAAIELEMAAEENITRGYDFSLINEGGKILIDPLPVIQAAVEDLKGGVSVGRISARFHNGVVAMIADVCARIREQTGISEVTLGGGVFQNMLIVRGTKSRLESQGFKVYLPREVPANDGGICLGQAAVALRRME
jgi:hydrogenase maturation protein HypF